MDLFGVVGLGEARDDDLEGVLDGLVMGLLVEFLLDFVELVDFFLVALDGLAGVLKFCSSPAPSVRLNSRIGDIVDLLLAVDFLVDCGVALEAGRLALEDDEELLVFFMDAGVVLAFEDLGLGVLLMGFEARLAGVAGCLAMSLGLSTVANSLSAFLRKV